MFLENITHNLFSNISSAWLFWIAARSCLSQTLFIEKLYERRGGEDAPEKVHSIYPQVVNQKKLKEKCGGIRKDWS